MDGHENRTEAEETFDFTSLFADEEVPPAAPAEEEQRSLASTLFARLKSLLFSPAQEQEEATGDTGAESAVDSDAVDAGGEQEDDFFFSDEEEVSPDDAVNEERHPPISDAEVQAAATAITDAIKSASEQFGLELSDERALEVALEVIGQAVSLEQAELLVYGILAKEAQKQGVNAKRHERREFAGGTEDTLDLFVRLASA